MSDHMGNHNAALQQFMEGRAPQPAWCSCSPSNLMLIGCDCAPPDFAALAAHAYSYAEEHYADKDARFDVIVECMSKAEIAQQLEEQGIHDYAAAVEWAKRQAGLQHEQELNQAWDGPESCIGSSQYNSRYDASGEWVE